MEHAAFRIESALVPQERVVLVARLPRRSSELLLEAVEVEERDLIFLGRRPVDLRVGVLQEGFVAGLREADDLDVVVAVRAPEPQAVLDDRAADVEAPVA